MSILTGFKLNFPSWEYIKGLPLKNEETGFYEEYRWILFETGIPGVSGVLTWNEDGQKKLVFDVFVGGYSGESGFDKVFNGNKEGYKKMRGYVFDEVYLKILHSLNKDMSWQWE